MGFPPVTLCFKYTHSGLHVVWGCHLHIVSRSSTSICDRLTLHPLSCPVSPVSAPSSTIQMQQKPPDVPVAMPVPLPFSTSLMAQSTSIMTPNIMAPSTGLMAPIGRPTVMPPHHTMVEDERLKLFEQVSRQTVGRFLLTQVYLTKAMSPKKSLQHL